MRTSYNRSAQLALALVSLSACAPGEPQEGAGAPLGSDIATGTLEPAAIVARTPLGAPAMVSLRRAGGFVVDRADARPALSAWVRAHARDLGLEPRADLALELTFDRTVPAGALTLLRHRQLYRGIPIAGAAEQITLSVDAGGRVVTVAGAPIDASIAYDGIEARLSPEEARAHLLAAAAGGEIEGAIELIALPERRALAYRAEVSDHRRVYVRASTGEPLHVEDLAAHSAFDHTTVHVRALNATYPELTGHQIFYNQPGHTVAATGNPYTDTVAMGNERAMAYFEQDLAAPPVRYTTPAYVMASGLTLPYRYFNNSTLSSDLFRTQTLFVRTQSALALFDPAMSTVGWDHHPNSNFGVLQKEPLTLIVSEQHSGICGAGWGGRTISSLHNGFPGHPYSNIYTTHVAVCDEVYQGTPVLYHELGHYLDIAATYGMMGSGLISNTCHQDTTDEAGPLGETIGEMVGLYLLGTTLDVDYTLSGSPAHACSFEALGIGSTVKVHHPSCLPAGYNLGWFDNPNERPAENNYAACNPSTGYSIPSVSQAVWAYLHNKHCSRVAPYSCNTRLVPPGVPSLPEQFLTAMIYALEMGNAQSYHAFFENMATGIWAHYGDTEEQYFRDVMGNYGLL